MEAPGAGDTVQLVVQPANAHWGNSARDFYPVDCTTHWQQFHLALLQAEMLKGWCAYISISLYPYRKQILKHADDTTLMAESEEELKSLLMKVKVRGSGPGNSIRPR